MINNDILIYLLRFLDKNTLNNFDKAFPYLASDIIKEKKRRFALSYNIHIKKIIGIQNLMNAPILKFKKSFLSFNFIDKIKLSDIRGNKIMTGIDILGRNFLVLHNKKDYSIFVIYDKKKNDKKLCGFLVITIKVIGSTNTFFLKKNIRKNFWIKSKIIGKKLKKLII